MRLLIFFFKLVHPICGLAKSLWAAVFGSDITCRGAASAAASRVATRLTTWAWHPFYPYASPIQLYSRHKMTSWFSKGRPALREALEEICNQIDVDIAAGTYFRLPLRATLHTD